MREVRASGRAPVPEASTGKTWRGVLGFPVSSVGL